MAADSTRRLLFTAADHPLVPDSSPVWALTCIPAVIVGLQHELARNDIRRARAFIRDLNDYIESFSDADGPDGDVLETFADELHRAMATGWIIHPEALDQFVIRCERLAAHVAGGEMVAA